MVSRAIVERDCAAVQVGQFVLAVSQPQRISSDTRKNLRLSTKLRNNLLTYDLIEDGAMS
mgnify:FL=1